MAFSGRRNRQASPAAADEPAQVSPRFDAMPAVAGTGEAARPRLAFFAGRLDPRRRTGRDER